MNSKLSSSFFFILKFWLPTLGWAGLIFYLSHLPSSAFPSLEIPHLDKFAHVFVFGVLALLLLRNFKASFPQKSLPYLRLLTVAAALIYALTDEWHQGGVAGRVPSLSDLAADGLGVFLFLFVIKRD